MIDDDPYNYDPDPGWPTDPVEAPEDSHAADMLLRRIGRLRAERDEVAELYAAERARLDAWLADRTDGLDAYIARIERTLIAWLQANGRTSVTLPHGKVGSRKGGKSLVIDDPDLLLAWCDQNLPDAIDRTPRLVGKADLRKLLPDPPAGEFGESEATEPIVTADGEVIPGVAWATGGRSYGVTSS